MAEMLGAVPLPSVDASQMELNEINKDLKVIFDNANQILANPDLNIENYTRQDVLSFYHGYRRLAAYLNVSAIITNPSYMTEGKYENKELVAHLIATASGALSMHQNPFGEERTISTAEFLNAVRGLADPIQASGPESERIAIPGTMVFDIQTASTLQLLEISWFYNRLLLGPTNAQSRSCYPETVGKSFAVLFPATGRNDHYQRACLDFFANLNQDKNLPATLMGEANTIIAEMQKITTNLNILQGQLKSALQQLSAANSDAQALEATTDERIVEIWQNYQGAFNDLADGVVGRIIFSNPTLTKTFGNLPFHSLAEIHLPTQQPSYWAGIDRTNPFVPHRNPFSDSTALENALKANIAAANEGIKTYSDWEVANVTLFQNFANGAQFSVDRRAIASDTIAKMIAQSPLAVGMVLGSTPDRQTQTAATMAIGQIIRVIQDKAAQTQKFIDWINIGSILLMALPIAGSATKTFGKAYWHSLARIRYYVPMIASSGISLFVFERQAQALSRDFYQSVNLWNQFIIASEKMTGNLNETLKTDAQNIKMQTVYWVMGTLLLATDAPYIARLAKETLNALKRTDGDGLRGAIATVKRKMKEGANSCRGIPVPA
jgi:hypothetical protein